MRVREQCGCGVTVWITGPPEADTSALVHALADRLRGTGRRVAVLDAGRAPRVGLTAEVLARNGVITLVRAAAPDPDGSTAVRQRHISSGTHFLVVRIAAPSAVDENETPLTSDLVIPANAHTTGLAPFALMDLLAERRFVEAGT